MGLAEAGARVFATGRTIGDLGSGIVSLRCDHTDDDAVSAVSLSGLVLFEGTMAAAIAGLGISGAVVAAIGLGEVGTRLHQRDFPRCQ